MSAIKKQDAAGGGGGKKRRGQSNDDKEDTSHYTLVDPTNVHAKGDGSFIACKDNAEESFTILSPAVELMWPRLAGEGDLGNSFTTKKGKKVEILERPKAKFSFAVTMGGMDDEVRELEPTLLEQQKAYFQKMYDAGCAILGSVFDERPEEFIDYIETAEDDVLDLESKLSRDPAITCKADLEAAMRTNAQLRAEIKAKQRKEFIKNAAYNFDDPDKFDEDGHIKKRGKDKKDKRIAVSFSRKVWRRQREFRKTEKKDMPIPQQYGTLKGNTPHEWNAVLEEMQSHWEYNPFVYHDLHTKCDLERPTFMPKGAAEPVPNPFWNPFANRLTLIQVRALFSVFTTDSSYGVKAVPTPEITIIRQKEFKRATSGYGISSGLATGVAKSTKRQRDDDDDAEHGSASVSEGDDGGGASYKKSKLLGGGGGAPPVPSQEQLDDMADD